MMLLHVPENIIDIIYTDWFLIHFYVMKGERDGEYF